MKTNGELQYLAQKYGWKAGPLTRARINRMTADESDWHSRFNGEEFTRAWKEEAVKAENRKNAETARTLRMHANEATEEETEKAIEEVKVFCSQHPQFIGSYVPNREALISWLREKNFPITARNLAKAFQALGAQGKILINPSALGIGTEQEISGVRLLRHPQLWKLLEAVPTAAQKEKLEQRKMSAAEWKEAHKEDFRETRLSDFQQRSWDQAIATFLLSRVEYKPTDENRKKLLQFIAANGLQINTQGLEAAFQYLKAKGELELNESNVIEGQATRYTNLGGSEPGFPPKSDKYSFQRKINSMGSQEYLERINNDPAFRAAVNALG